MIKLAIDHLVQEFLIKGYLTEENLDYSRNRVFRLLKLNGWSMCQDSNEERSIESDISEIVDYAIKMNIIPPEGSTFTDDFIGELTDCLIGRPSEVTNQFLKILNTEGIKSATDWFYTFCKDIDYIKSSRTSKNLNWDHGSLYGDLKITVNLSKPEKTPEEIKLAAHSKSDYPSCALCVENVGLGGVAHPPRQHHRIIPMNLGDDDYFFQYSPYAYFNEHCIVLSKHHKPMAINKKTIEVMMDFVKNVPHYFIAGNADLPIVGGSILSHDHFQGGDTVFPVEKSEVVIVSTSSEGETGILNWPVSAIRLYGTEEYVKLNSEKILNNWINYNNEAQNIISHTNGTRHNTVNFFFRKDQKNDKFIAIILLRNNRTDENHPDGIFHTRKLLQVIKKENIGIIEALGLAILPPRMKEEMEDFSKLPQFKDWLSSFPQEEQDKGPEYLIGETFKLLLEDVGVFKKTHKGQDAFKEFIKESIN